MLLLFLQPWGLFTMFKCLWRKVTNAVQATVDPIAAAAQTPEIKAAAYYWRQRIASARIGGALDPSFETTVRERFTEGELDKFEKQLAHDLASSFVYVKDNAIFQERGLDISFTVSCAARSVGLNEKLAYPGFFSRIRILMGKEVAYETEPYRSHNWVTIWSAPNDPKPE
jgi:hypothetical protein